MKILIISDIHGSLFHTKKIMEVIKKENFDKIIILGDILYHGYQNSYLNSSSIIKVCKMLNSVKEKIIAVKGNCDSSVDRSVLEFDMETGYKMIEVDGRKWYLTHGHGNHLLPELEDNAILFNGHTHVHELNQVFINPGSLSLPRGNSTNSYVIYENNIFYLYDLNDNLLQEKISL